jgi:hypothetical protein
MTAVKVPDVADVWLCTKCHVPEAVVQLAASPGLDRGIARATVAVIPTIAHVATIASAAKAFLIRLLLSSWTSCKQVFTTFTATCLDVGAKTGLSAC